MPPRSPRSPEGGTDWDKQEDIRDLCDTFGMLPHEAKKFWHLPQTLRARLASDPGQIDEIHQTVLEVTGQLEEEHGHDDHWDRARLAIAESFIVMGEFVRAADILSHTYNTEVVLEQAVAIVIREIRRGRLDPDVVFIFSDVMYRAYERAGKGEEFTAVGFSNLSQYLVANVEPTNRAKLKVKITDQFGAAPDVDPAAPRELSFSEASEYYFYAPWADLDPLAKATEKWPEDMGEDERLKFVVDFGIRLHETVEDTEIDRKTAEALKAFIADKQAGRSGEAWDVLRFISAVKMYDRNGAKFGRIFARSMDDQEMSAMVAYALLERKRDADAMDVLQDMRDKKLHGKILALGDWQNPAEIADLIEDLTQVTPKTRKKYDPKLRLGVAQGVHAVYARRVEEGDTSWAEQAEEMRKRAALLERQIAIGYITGKK